MMPAAPMAAGGKGQVASAGATVHCLLDDGRLLTVHASCRPRDGRADIKCHGPREIAQRVQQVLRLARHTEPVHDSRLQVVISLDPWPDVAQPSVARPDVARPDVAQPDVARPSVARREWELALVLADRIVRGLYQPPVPAALRVFAHGWSDQWQYGQVQGGDAARYAALLQQGGMLVLGTSAESAVPAGCFPLAHLGALHGHPDPAALVAASRCWFPLYSGGVHDSLNWLEVSVRPLCAPLPDEAVISVLGLDLRQQQAVTAVLQEARLFEQKSTRQWRTVVQFGHGGFYGDSWQLALVMADRIARGRDFPARARLIATGRSGAWHTGMVETVEACEAKCALILREAGRGDRVLLPAAWEETLPATFLTQLAAKGASCACVARLGLL